MSYYTPQALARAQQPLRDQIDRDEAFCTLGGLQAEQRESWSEERAATIRTVATAIVNFDTGAALGGSGADRFAGAGGAPPVAHAPTPPASPPASPVSRVVESPTAHRPTLLADAMRARLSPGQQSRQAAPRAPGVALAMSSMERELRRQGLTPAAGQAQRVDVLSASAASLDRELRRAGLIR